MRMQDKKCSVNKCNNLCLAKNWCRKHYLQNYLHGKIFERTKNDKNKIIYNNNKVVKFELYNRKCFVTGIAKISNIDINLLYKYKFFLGDNGYVKACTRKGNKRTCTYLHKLILKNKNKEVDHISGDKLDNRRDNLRNCTRIQNLMNRKNVLGVSFSKRHNRWRARIFIDGKETHLGNFKFKKDAIITRIKAENKYFKEYSPNKKYANII